MRIVKLLISLQILLANLFIIKPVLAYEGFEYIDEVVEEKVIDFSYININEVMPNPEGSDTDYEWVEIYSDLNDQDDQIDLEGCLLDSKEFPRGTFIDNESYLIVVKDLLDKDDDGQSFEQRWGDNSGEWGDSEIEDFAVVEMNISMKNSQDFISLECLDYEDAFEWEESKSGQSFSLDIDGEWTDEYLVTPGSENLPLPEIVYSHEILISEVYPSPNEEEEEWIELYNFGENILEIKDWILEDNSKSFNLGEYSIEARSYLVLNSEDLSITLNNGGETLTLYDPNEEEVDIFDYDSTDKGISNIRIWDNGMYQSDVIQSKVTTRGETNMYIDPDDLFYGVEVLTVSKARKKELGEDVCVSGVVTIEMNKLGSKLFYLQDEGGGIQVYFSKEDFWQDYKVGDKLKVIGELKESKGEERIYVNDDKAVLLESENENNFDPSEISTGDVGEKYEGVLVFVSGEIIETSGKSFTIDDSSGEIKILIKSSTDIETPKKKKGQFAGIVGIVSQYGDDDDSYRVLPRYENDIVISDEPVKFGQVLAVTGENINLVFFLGVLMLLVWTRRSKPALGGPNQRWEVQTSVS